MIIDNLYIFYPTKSAKYNETTFDALEKFQCLIRITIRNLLVISVFNIPSFGPQTFDSISTSLSGTSLLKTIY